MENCEINCMTTSHIDVIVLAAKYLRYLSVNGKGLQLLVLSYTVYTNLNDNALLKICNVLS